MESFNAVLLFSFFTAEVVAAVLASGVLLEYSDGLSTRTVPLNAAAVCWALLLS